MEQRAISLQVLEEPRRVGVAFRPPVISLGGELTDGLVVAAMGLFLLGVVSFDSKLVEGLAVD